MTAIRIVDGAIMRIFARAGRSLQARLNHLTNRMREIWHRRAFRMALDNTGDSTSDQWIVFSYYHNSIYTCLAFSQIAAALVRRGWHAKFLFQGKWFGHTARSGHIDGCLHSPQGARGTDYYHAESDLPTPKLDWQIDFDRQEVIAGGVNYYDIVLGTIGHKFKIYEVDFDNPEIRAEAVRFLRTIEVMLGVARELEAAANAGKRVVIVTNRTYFGPNAVLFEYFTTPDRLGKVELYLCGTTYTLYYTRESRPDMLMTRVTGPEIYDQLCIPQAAFERWYGALTETDFKAIRGHIMPVIESKWWREMFRNIPGEDEIDRRIAAARTAGRPVYCLFAHVLYEHPIRDRTTCFDDLIDWIGRTVDAFGNIEGLLLLKPHGMEAAAGDLNTYQPTQKLADVFARLKESENVILLPPEKFLANEVCELIDAALIWRSTAWLEMTIFGVPAIYCGPCDYFYKPMGLRAPETITEYVERLIALPNQKPDAALRRRAIALLYYINRVRVVPISDVARLPKWLGGGNQVLGMKTVLNAKWGYCGSAQPFVETIVNRADDAHGRYAAELRGTTTVP